MLVSQSSMVLVSCWGASCWGVCSYDSLDALDEALEGEIEEMVQDPSINMKKPHRALLIRKLKKRVSNK